MLFVRVANKLELDKKRKGGRKPQLLKQLAQLLLEFCVVAVDLVELGHPGAFARQLVELIDVDGVALVDRHHVDLVNLADLHLLEHAAPFSAPGLEAGEQLGLELFQLAHQTAPPLVDGVLLQRHVDEIGDLLDERGELLAEVPALTGRHREQARTVLIREVLHVQKVAQGARRRGAGLQKGSDRRHLAGAARATHKDVVPGGTDVEPESQRVDGACLTDERSVRRAFAQCREQIGITSPGERLRRQGRDWTVGQNGASRMVKLPS